MNHLESWSLPIIGQALRRETTTVQQFLAALDIDAGALERGLESLVISRLISLEPGTPTRAAGYSLTAKGRDLGPVVTEVDRWSTRWESEDGAVGEGEGQPAVLAAGTRGIDSTMKLCVLGAFALWVGGSPAAPLSTGAQHLLVLLALRDRVVSRSALAGQLWPDSSNDHAAVSLRATLSRLDGPSRDALVVTPVSVALSDAVVVDVRRARTLANRLVLLDSAAPDADLSAESLSLLSAELLPDWDEDWISAEAEDWRQLRLSGLEAAARLLIERGRLDEAAGAARAAIKVEPLRESAQATLIRVHLAKGNQSEALQVFDRFGERLDEALGLEPTEHLFRLVDPIRQRRSLASPTASTL